jgi:RNA polymerase sigma factor (sigma-70 family)
MATNPPAEPSALSPTDRSLVRHIRAGDQTAADALYKRYASRIRRLVRAASPHVVQSVFRVVYRQIAAQKYDVPADGDLWRLLAVLAANKLRDHIRHHRTAKRNVFQTAGGDDPDRTPARADETAEAHLRMTVDDYLAGLTEADRRVVAARLLGHTVNEISADTGRAVRTVERVLRQARDRLAELLAI